MAEGEVIFVRKATGLVRTAGVVTTAAISFGYLTQGITYYPSMDVYWFPGLNMPIAYGLAGFIMIWPLFIAIFLTQAMPRSASDYVAVARIVNPTISYIGTLIQWQNWAWVATATAPGIVQCFGQACVMYGKMTGNTSLVALMQPIATFGTNVLLAVSIISLIVFALLCIVGMRISGWVLNIMFAGMLVGVVLGTASLVWYALQGQAATAAAWDRAYGAGAWKEIEDVAIANGWRNYVEKSTGDPNMWGWPGKWDWSITLAGVLPACYAWWGMELANQVAGEIKEPSKTYPTAMAIVLVIATIWYMLTASCMMMAFGEHYPMYVYNLIEGYSANYKINPEVFPMTTFFTGSISGNPALAFIIHFFTGLNLPSGALACFIVCSRVIFALSFDRVFPSIFARVNDRWRTPHWAIALTVIYGLLWLPVYVYLPYVAAWNTYASCALRYMFMGWAALIMPYKFPDLYERGYPYRIAGIPLLTIIGLFGTVTSTWLFVNNIVNIGREVASFESTMVQVFWITFSVVLWSFFYNYRKSKGIDMDKLYQEIPPA